VLSVKLRDCASADKKTTRAKKGERALKDKDEISLDALLQEQEKKTLLATVEAMPGKPDMVKVTPWIPGRGCACQFAMVFQKTSIKKLTRTAHRHYCCGKMLSVVEIEIDEKAVLPLHEVFADMSMRAAFAAMQPRRSTTHLPFFLSPAGRKLFGSYGFSLQDDGSKLGTEQTSGGSGNYGGGGGDDGGDTGGDMTGDTGDDNGAQQMGDSGPLTKEICVGWLDNCLRFADRIPDPEAEAAAVAACVGTYYACIAAVAAGDLF
jgi:hypothetical protein